MRSGLVLFVATLVLVPVASRAQQPGACPSIQNDQERLACYDRAMRGAPATSAPPASSPQVAPAPASPPAAAPAPASTQAAPTTTEPAGSPNAAGAAAGAAAAAAVVAPSAQATAAPPAAATPSSTISTAPHSARNTTPATPPQPAAPPGIDPHTGVPTGIIPVVVVSALSRPGFGTEFTTDTAGVWIQTETKSLLLPKTPFNAELQPGKLGGTFLVVPDRKLGIRVRAPNK
jgi:hypothetical protein